MIETIREPQLLPEWVLNILPKRQPAEGANGRAQSVDGDVIPEGQRDSRLTSMAGAMRHQGMTEEEIASALLTVNRARCSPPLPDEQIKKIAWSVGRYPPAPQVATVSHNGQRAQGPAPRKWPDQIAPEAFYGLAGHIVQTIAPHTEADPASLLLNTLAAFGNAVGPSPHAIAEAARHGTNINVVVVGETSKARKDSSSGRVKDVLRLADPGWVQSHIQSGGLSSGEGLIWAVRDPVEKRVKPRDGGDYTTEIVDEGISDKRLLIVESEFASTLKVMSREGNTLSPVIRQAWDAGTLSTLTKNSPARASGAHISIIGHVTKDELLRYLSETEAGNGFANRFLFGCARRSQVLPDGGGIPHYGDLVRQLHDSLERGRQLGVIQRDDESRRAWATVYPTLSEGKLGLFGAVTARAEAQVLRLSVIYAVLDGSDVIRLPHLLAALAVREYCEASAKYIFGDATGDSIADRILESLHQSPEGLNRTQIHGLLGRNSSGGRLDLALGLLLRTSRARFIRVDTDGRTSEVWYAV